MPGSIRVSVLQIPVTSPLFLKVAVGKREYDGSVGEGDFSFPVTSLRENLVLMLYNAKRDLISQTELKIISIVEKGTWDVSFTHGSGGNALLQLQFSLSEEERKRIQEVRNSALKRKQKVLLKDGHESSFLESPASKQCIIMVANNSSKGNQATIWRSLSLDDLQRRDIFSANCADPHMENSGDMALQSTVRDSSGLEEGLTDIRKEKNSASNRSGGTVKKMISTFESSLSQSQTPITRIKSESSLKRLSSMAKSSEMLSETSLQTNNEHSEPLSLSKQRETHFDRTTWQNNDGKSNLISNPKSDQNEKSSKISVKPRFANVTDDGTPTSALFETRKGVFTKSLYKATSASQENRSSASSNVARRSNADTEARTSGKASISSRSKGSHSRSEKSVMFILKKSNASGNKNPSDFPGKDYDSSDASVDCTSSGDLSDAGRVKSIVKLKNVDAGVSKHSHHSHHLNPEMVGRGMDQTKKQNFQGHVSRKVIDRSTFISDSLQQIHVVDPANFGFSGNHDEHPTRDCFGTFNIWMPPHLCVTTGSRQLRDLFEQCSMSSRPEESMLITDANEKQNADNGEVNINERICRRADGMSVLNGWLINQGVRFVIVVIACGAIFINNR